MTSAVPANRRPGPAAGGAALTAGLVMAFAGAVIYILYLNKLIRGSGFAILVLGLIIAGGSCAAAAAAMFSKANPAPQQLKGSVGRGKFGAAFMACGYPLALAGAFLTFLQGHAIFGFLYHADNDALSRLFDMPAFLLMIGFGLVLYGAYQVLRALRPGAAAYISGDAVRAFLLNNAIILALIIMIIAMACANPKFAQISVFVNILHQSSTRLIIALGLCFTLLVGGIDLSANRILGMAVIIAPSMLQTADYGNRFYPNLPQVNLLIPIALAILACMVFGLINGLLIARFKVPAYVATLAVQVLVYGAASLYFDMPPNKSQPIGGLRTDFTNLGQYLIFNKIPVLIPVAVFFIILVWFILRKTAFGKNMYAVGANRKAAFVSGVNVGLTIVGAFVLASVFYGAAGVLEAARTGGTYGGYGLGYELDAIAACVLGGVSFRGGVGRVRGIVVSVLVLTVIQYGLTFIGLNPYWQQIIKGVIIAAAVAMDAVKNKKHKVWAAWADL